MIDRVLMERTGRGEVMYSLPNSVLRPKWPHPWKTEVSSVETEDGGNEVVAMVRPGTVNGELPLVPGGRIAGAEEEEGDGAVELWHDVEIPLPGSAWRVVEPAGVPTYFRALGVGAGDSLEAMGIEIDVNTGSVQVNSSVFGVVDKDDPLAVAMAGAVLRETDIFLAKAKAAYKVETDISPEGVVTGSLVNYTAQYNMAGLVAWGDRARLLVGQVPTNEGVGSGEQSLLGVAGPLAQIPGGVDAVDTLLVAKIYELRAEEPVGIQYFVQHHVFYNLYHEAKNDMPLNMPTDMLDPMLSFFVGRYVAPGMVMAAQNEAMDRVMTDIMNSTTNQGRWWTA